MTETVKTTANPAPDKEQPPKKPYESPRVVSFNALEVIAGACLAPQGKEVTGTCLIGQS